MTAVAIVYAFIAGLFAQGTIEALNAHRPTHRRALALAVGILWPLAVLVAVVPPAVRAIGRGR